MGQRYPAQLSGGQRQRVGVARALAADPPLMLMDEPFGAIDPINRTKLQDEFLALQAKVRKTVVFVTHDIDEAIKMGDRIAILREGGVLAQYDTPKEILARPADDFVAKFVGADRGIKRLSLTTLGELELLAVDGTSLDGLLRLPDQASVKDALSVLLTAHGEPLAVEDGEGNVSGLLTLSHLERLISEEADGEGSQAGLAMSATPASQPDLRARKGRARAPAGVRRRGRPRVVSGRLLAAGGPVIPNFSAHSSSCAVHNRLFCFDWVKANWGPVLWPALRQHVVLTAIAVSIGFVIALALALFAHRHRWAERPTLLVTTFLYTIPSLALFELLVAPVGENIFAAEIALVSYTLLILFRNTLTGLRSVPPDVLEAAEGMGMSRRQALTRVELPLALPSIVAGLRIAVVTIIALATIVYTIYNRGLGVPIHDALGEGPFKTELIVAGGMAILLALLADGLLVAVQRLLTPWSRIRERTGG